MGCHRNRLFGRTHVSLSNFYGKLLTVPIRVVELADADEIARIYAPIVEQTHISFEDLAPTPQAMRERIRSYTLRYPWLVSEYDGGLHGYAYASAHRTRPAYRWSVDCSVYVDPRSRGRGIATALYRELFVR